jgi:site-specific recombinase
VRATRAASGNSPRIAFLRAQLGNQPEWRARVGAALTRLIGNCDAEQLLVHGGIWRDFHLVGAMREWFEFRVLPGACATSDGADVLALAFREADAGWLRDPSTVHLLRELIDASLFPALEAAINEAIEALGHQIVAQAQSRTIRALAGGSRSPFRGLSEALRAFVRTEIEARDAQSVVGRVKQCLLTLESHRLLLVERGADLNTTFQLSRLAQQLQRLRLLVVLGCRGDDAVIGECLAELLRSVTRNSSGRRLFSRSTDLVLQNLVEGAASVGRNYLDDEHSSWRAAFGAGLGGGAIMAVGTVVKYFFVSQELPEFYQGLVFSVNYAAAFCAAYLLHFTIATKLPAHTAAALAKTARDATGHRARLGAFLALWRATLRLQVAGLLGNLVAAGPMALALDALCMRLAHRHLLDLHTAHHVLSSNSLLGPSALYAALTGFLLWISSLLAAAANNWARVVGLEDRLATNVKVMGSAGVARARTTAVLLVARFGGLVGNLSLGFMLGAIPALFVILRLPIDIRHVTVSAASFALAVAGTGHAGAASSVWLAASGIAVIGLVNISVSFALALWLAVRFAAGRHGSRTAYPLMRVALRRWLRRSAPPAAPPAATTIKAPA